MSKDAQKENINEIERLQMAEHLGKWYGWGSPIGLSIFFLTLTLIGVIITNVVVGIIK